MVRLTTFLASAVLSMVFLASAVLFKWSFQGSAVVVDQPAAIFFNPYLTCETQEIEGESQRLCYTYYELPATSHFPNDFIYHWPDGYDFNFYEGLAPNIDTRLLTEAQNAKHLLPNTVRVSCENGICQVKVSGTQCSSCSICSKNEFKTPNVTISADCANIDGGRKVTCEKAFVYYPLKRTNDRMEAIERRRQLRSKLV